MDSPALRIDVVTIFPDYLAPLSLSLPGKAQAAGLLEVAVHDLRDWAHDRHRTVDDTPYGGGAGMVMRPEPWGEALDAVLAEASVLVVPTPSGLPFTQKLAAELSGKPHLVFACGRYEGIDQRVMDYYASTHDVREVSIGDYVLNGGEVAVLAMVEAVARLVPGFMGNAASLAEESHTDGLLEYPVFTKPASWRGLDVPEVLLSGNHARIEGWRLEQSRLRTAARRPDLLSPTVVPGGGEFRRAVRADAGEILTLQLACWVPEAQANPQIQIPAHHETLDDVVRSFDEWSVYVLRREGRLVGAVRGQRTEGNAWHIGRLMVAPDLRGQGLGRWLLEQAELLAPPEATMYELITGANSESNQRRYKRAGYRLSRTPAPPGAVGMYKPVKRPAES